MIKEALNIEYNSSEETIKQRFALLAELLFNQYEIIKGNTVYRFLEIEFYLHSKNHPDTTTYKREMRAGRWHTHLSGVDISFESTPECYGGILVRSIMDSKGKIINGPLCTLFELFDNIDIDVHSNSNIPFIKKREDTCDINIKTATRFNINSGKYKDCSYRYYNASESIKWKSGYAANPMRQIFK